MRMKNFNIFNKILIANKLCILRRPSWKTWSTNQAVQLKNRLCEQDIIILQS